jgi:hypothetical protein
MWPCFLSQGAGVHLGAALWLMPENLQFSLLLVAMMAV